MILVTLRLILSSVACPGKLATSLFGRNWLPSIQQEGGCLGQRDLGLWLCCPAAAYSALPRGAGTKKAASQGDRVWAFVDLFDDLSHNDPESSLLCGLMLVFIPHGLLRNSVLHLVDLCIQERRSLIDFSSYNKNKLLSL